MDRPAQGIESVRAPRNGMTDTPSGRREEWVRAAENRRSRRALDKVDARANGGATSV
ncbi:hypothetical protein GCM10009677_39570 [Sphaerisporangium rubeum]